MRPNKGYQRPRMVIKTLASLDLRDLWMLYKHKECGLYGIYYFYKTSYRRLKLSGEFCISILRHNVKRGVDNTLIKD